MTVQGLAPLVFVMQRKPTQLHRPSSNCKDAPAVIEIELSQQKTLVDPVDHAGRGAKQKKGKEPQPFTSRKSCFTFKRWGNK